MKRFLTSMLDMLADAALFEMDVPVLAHARTVRDEHESLEERLIEVAFAEAADFDDIHEAILREQVKDQDIARPDDCQYGDNEPCFV